MTRVCIANIINLQKIVAEISMINTTDTNNNNKDKSVNFEFTYHPWYPVIQLK